ncbi:hypothetical protein [Ferrovibrio terrae]|uniref:hypothetical protein n=1 Tax=Ferrovibrio terrae TaxID=2594003 RepID=UPI00313815B7
MSRLANALRQLAMELENQGAEEEPVILLTAKTGWLCERLLTEGQTLYQASTALPLLITADGAFHQMKAIGFTFIWPASIAPQDMAACASREDPA